MTEHENAEQPKSEDAHLTSRQSEGLQTALPEDTRERFETFVRENLGDAPVMDRGRYISPKIQKYWLTWQAAIECVQ